MADEIKPGSDASAEQPGAEPDRRAQPVDAEQPPRLPFPVVGVGASAGGIEAFGGFLDVMPPDGGMAFVFILHLPPDAESHLADILGRRTAMPVQQVEDGMPVAVDHVYVIRPGHVVTIRDGGLRLGPELGGPRAANRPVDDFFRSLAEEQRERAVCVILSGMGSNGTAGAQAVKAVGGLCVAQDPDGAQYPSMPRHLVDAGYADHVLRPSEIPAVLLTYAGSPYATGGREANAGPVFDKEGHHLREVLAVLRTRTKQDFTGYKKATLLRRVQRRMGLARLTSLAEYAKLLRQTPAEVVALGDDLLIHVTGFFRDPEAWDAVRQRVVVPLVASREPGAAVRAWVAACSSGEEAYSLAMLLIEESERAEKALDVKVFATDLADRTLAHARAGVYPGGIESELSKERLDRFFAREAEHYRVRADLRDRVVFAPQNILQDPPFSRLDIATCRNLLIYLEADVQKRVLHLLHFGLREGGALFLGSSETVGGVDSLFEVIDKKARIFRRVGPTRHGAVDFPLPHSVAVAEDRSFRATATALSVRPRRSDGPAGSVAELARQTLLDAHTPPAATVDRDGQVVYFHGDATPYVRISGEPTRELLLLAREGVRGAARAALQRAAAENVRATVPDGWVDRETGRRHRVAITASPVVDPDAGDGPPVYFVVSFDDRGEIPAPGSGGAAGATDGWDAEVRRLRSELQGTIEELQSSNEELKASNEEVTSVNEELQSANEELETSKEEMQSLNEELTTVNAQLRIKADEYQTTSSDLGSLLASTDIAVLFLDTSFRIRRFTPTARDLIDLIPGDIGRPLSALARKFDDPALDADCRTVLERLTPVEREVGGEGCRHFLRRVTPYRTTDNRIDGVVIVFVDVTERRKADAALRASEEKYRTLFESIDEGVTTFEVIFDDKDRVVDALYLETNPACFRLTGLPSGFIGKRVSEVIPDLEQFWLDTYERVAKTGKSERFEHEVAGIGRWFDLHVSRVGSADRVTLVTVYNNITDRKRREAHQAVLVGIGDDLSGLVTPDEIMSAVGSRLGEHLNLGVCVFVDVDEGRGEVTVHHGWNKDGVPSLKQTFRMVDFLTEEFARASRAGEVFVVRNSATDARVDADAYARLNIGAWLGVPFHRAGRWTAFLAVTDVAPRDWRDDEIELVRNIADRVFPRIERARAEAALRLSEGRLRLALAAARMGIWTLEVGTGAQMRDAKLNALLGLEAAESTQPFDEFVAHVHPDDRATVREAFVASTQKGQPLSIEFRIVRPDGGVRWLRDQGDVFGDATAGRRHMAGACVDITDVKAAEDALRDARDKLEMRVAERTAELGAEVIRRKELALRLNTVQEDERQRVARDLHDTVGQLMAGLSMAFKAVERAGALPVPIADKLAEAQAITAELGKEVHALAVRLRPTSLEDLGLEAALSGLVGEWSHRTGITAEFHAAGSEGHRLPSEVETAVYRVVQEALTNVAKHARATSAGVVVRRPVGFLSVAIEDNGAGFDPSAATSRLGLLGMRERVDLVGGELNVESSPGAGTTVIVTIPIPSGDKP